MKVMHAVVGVALSCAASFATQASACTYFVDNQAAENDLAAAAVSHLGASLAYVEDLSIDHFRWFESISTPMCPQELTFEATVTVTYQNNLGTFPEDCKATVSVVRVDDWTTNIETFTFTIASQKCELAN